MAAPFKASMCLATQAGFVLPGAASNDFLVYTGNSAQSMLFGVSNTRTIMRVDGAGNLAFAGNVAFSNMMQLSGVQIIQRTSALTNNVTSSVTAVNGFNYDANGGIQLTMSNGNNAIAFFQSNNEYARISSNGFVGIGVTNPLGTLHMANRAINSNNIIIEAGNSIDGSLPGISAINFNGYFSGTRQRINTGKNLWRLFVNQNGNADVLALETWNGTSACNVFACTSNGNVGIGLINPSNALEVTGNIVCSGNMSANNLGMFRNRLINGNMMINQRSLATYSAGGYNLDRWSTYAGGSGTLAITQQSLTSSDAPYSSAGLMYSLRVTASTSCSFTDCALIQQNIENFNLMDLGWGATTNTSVTLSFWFKSNSTGSHSIALRNAAPGGSSFWAAYTSSFSYASSGTWQYVTITIPSPPAASKWNMTPSPTSSSIGIQMILFTPSTSYVAAAANTWYYNVVSPLSAYQQAPGTVNWASTAGNYVEVTGVQLEKGTLATPFEYRPYPVELQLCQRYLYRISGGGTYNNLNALLGMGITYNTTGAFYYITIPNMRATPTMSNAAVGNFQLWTPANQGTANLLNVGPDGNSTCGLRIDAATSSTLTANLPSMLRANGVGASAWIEFWAEL